METFSTAAVRDVDHSKTISRTKRSSFYVGAGILALLIVLSGFSLTYISPLMSGTFEGRPLLHIHGAMFLTWILLFICQPLLVKLGYTKIHRKIGLPAFILAGCMVIVGVMVAISAARLNRDGGSGIGGKAFLLIPLTDMVLFATFITISILNLKKSETHKRLMLLATVAIIPAAFGRLFGMFDINNILVMMLMMESLVLAGITNDLIQRRKVHHVYIWGGAGMTLVHLFRFPLSGSAWWLSVADWIVK
jgi:hypothetical protein